MIEITICDVPAGSRQPRGHYAELKQALMNLPEGKAIRVPLDTFKHNPKVHIRFSPSTNFKMRTRRTLDGWFLWTEKRQMEDVR